MSLIAIAECFSSPQASNIKSERLIVKVKKQDLNVGDLKQAITRKGYPSLCDVTRMTLIVPVGSGIVLMDEMKASDFADQPLVLALMSTTTRETAYLHAGGGLNIPHLLYVYQASNFRSYMKLPKSLMVVNAGKWTTWDTAWSASFSDLAHHFTTLGFDHDLVSRELQRIEQRKVPVSSSTASAGVYAPNLLFRLWDAVGFNSLVNTERQMERCNRDDASEHESWAAPSDFSIETASTVIAPEPTYPVPPPSIPSVVMDDPVIDNPIIDNPVIDNPVIYEPSEHESAYDSVYYRDFTPPFAISPSKLRPSRSYRSDSDTIMAGSTSNPALETDTPSQSPSPSGTVHNIEDSNTVRDQLSSHFPQPERNDTSAEDVLILERRQKEFDLERLQRHRELEAWGAANGALKEQIVAETAQIDALFVTFERLRNQHNDDAERNLEVIQLAKDNLSNIVSCPKCGQRYGSSSEDEARRPVHLSCGDTFCAGCLSEDWRKRTSAGLNPQFRCFNECTFFNPKYFADVHLLDEVKDILSLVPSRSDLIPNQI